MRYPTTPNDETSFEGGITMTGRLCTIIATTAVTLLVILAVLLWALYTDHLNFAQKSYRMVKMWDADGELAVLDCKSYLAWEENRKKGK